MSLTLANVPCRNASKMPSAWKRSSSSAEPMLLWWMNWFRHESACTLTLGCGCCRNWISFGSTTGSTLKT